MTEMRPLSSVKVLTGATEGEFSGIGEVGQRCASSNASPARNLAGYVLGVVLNNSCPTPQDPVRVGILFDVTSIGED